ncbi:hypothetical protein CYMTET_45294 [Cymbomonas tetramitiformis]|uniref:Anaphase-promoting complex subunit 1 beta-sandwich domain-containing protein n=1 Tax=Cymbomonas tetramitiformis TaxID=36881 RepID=A0AAE0EY62_9CHLO|nr:hypothetical protein CYMTET_45294 [Cymbomonas tetramitiformis]
MEGDMVNLDVTSPAATLALGLMFLKTNDVAVAGRLSIPDTQFALDYVRPDFILLRLTARSLILWDAIRPTKEWVEAQLPELLQGALDGGDEATARARMMRGARGVRAAEDDIDREALAQAHANALAGACMSLGLRYAGSANADAAELVEHYTNVFMKLKRQVAAGSPQAPPVDRPTLETCLDVAVLALSIIMAGTGNLNTLRLLRRLRRRLDSTPGGLTYGNHMAISMALGFLFLGGGQRTFATSNKAIAALLIAVYPRFPTSTSDNRCHLQAFRHLYVLAAEARCVEAVDVDTWQPVYVPLSITVKEDAAHAEGSLQRTTPCLLPELSCLKEVRVCGPRYWGQSLLAGDKALSALLRCGTLYVKRKLGALPYAEDPIGSRSLLSRAFHTRGSHTPAATVVSDGDVDKHKFEMMNAFSADPSILGFAEHFCSDNTDFGSFCRLTHFLSPSGPCGPCGRSAQRSP